MGAPQATDAALRDVPVGPAFSSTCPASRPAPLSDLMHVPRRHLESEGGGVESTRGRARMLGDRRRRVAGEQIRVWTNEGGSCARKGRAVVTHAAAN